MYLRNCTMSYNCRCALISERKVCDVDSAPNTCLVARTSPRWSRKTPNLWKKRERDQGVGRRSRPLAPSDDNQESSEGGRVGKARYSCSTENEMKEANSRIYTAWTQKMLLKTALHSAGVYTCRLIPKSKPTILLHASERKGFLFYIALMWEETKFKRGIQNFENFEGGACSLRSI